MANPFRVVIADDHTLFRRGLISLINETQEYIVVGEASSGPDAVRLANDLHPDLVLMDVHMPGGGGVAALAQLRESNPSLPVVMLTVSENDADLIAAIRAGARGYFLKNVESEQLFDGLRRALSGQAVVDPSLTDRLFHHVAGTASLDSPLSHRETEILKLIAAGCTNNEIAAKLVVSQNTIKTHIARIFEKLDATSREQAVARAKEQGWIS